MSRYPFYRFVSHYTEGTEDDAQKEIEDFCYGKTLLAPDRLKIEWTITFE